MNKDRLVNIALVLMMLVGTGLLLYPTVSDWWNSTRQTRAIAGYVEAADDLDTSQQEAMLAEARAYNQELADHVAIGALDDEMAQRYGRTLDVTDTGIMAYIEIPSLRCSLPVYHGTDEGVLQVAVGHLEWTSLPVGGEGTHCVISGHRGLPSAKLFTNLDQLIEGDVFELHVVGEVYAYEVDQIRIVLPHEVEELEIVPGEDLCTLVTCTPYGINTHRLLVRGHRVEAASQLVVAADAVRVDPNTVASVVAVPLLAAAVIVLLVNDSRKRRRRAAVREARQTVEVCASPRVAETKAGKVEQDVDFRKG